MVMEVTPVMTNEKWAQGQTFEQYVASIQANKDAFQRNYETFNVNAEDAEWFKQFAARKGGRLRMVIIGEDWCPDVVRGLPVVVRLAEAADMEYRIFARDQHPDLMSQYLWRHEYQSIPVVVFFTDDWKELGHWIERPAIAYKQMAELTDELENLQEEERLKVSRERRNGWGDLWKQETVRELKELLYRVM